MKKQFALLLLAVLSISTFAEARDVPLTPIDSARTFSDLRSTAEVVKQGPLGYMKIAQGDVVCERKPKPYNNESLIRYNYSCTVYEEDPILPAYRVAPPRAFRRAQ